MAKKGISGSLETSFPQLLPDVNTLRTYFIESDNDFAPIFLKD
jgi:hypothetical protein